MKTMKQIVVPVFYEFDSSDIRKLKASFEEAFAEHMHDSSADVEEVQRWKSALVEASNLSGWDSRNYDDDAKHIEKIVGDISKRLIRISCSKDNVLVGMDKHIAEIDVLLCLGVDDVHGIGIFGMPCTGNMY